MNKYWAHSAREGTAEKHELEKHLESTAQLAKKFAETFDPEHLAYIAGLWHDLGKYFHEFQKYLDNPNIQRKYRDHSTAGGVYAFRMLDWSKAFIVAFLIFSHHSGLISAREIYERIDDRKHEPYVLEPLERSASFLKRHAGTVNSTQSSYWDPKKPNMISLEMRIRMLFSALVDADFLDTEHHYAPEKVLLRKSSKTPAQLFDMLITHYQMLEQREESDRPINRTRSAIFHRCVEKADSSQSFFLLTVPTGLGKTLSSMGFALKHAATTKKRRVIVALPYTSIIDQNAAEYKKIFGDDSVLEHHSQAVWGAEPSNDNEKMKLASENWEIPVVVTTTVQLFESLFANKTSAVRKLHNIADSVIILDEFQMLPLHLLEPIFSTMEELMMTYNVTFVASSATPLSFEWKEYFHKADQPVSLIEDSEALFEQYLRVSYVHEQRPLKWEVLSKRILEHEQVLVIVNTRKDALELYRTIRQENTKVPVYHLSTLMCSKHRQEVLNEVKEILSNRQPVCVISTQLIEAGVDIDFPVVFRAIGPLDSIVQAAGRCNREGKLPAKGRVIIYEPSEGGMPSGDYRTATDQTKITLNDHWQSLHLPQTYINYFKKLYRLSNLDKKRIQTRRSDPQQGLDFPRMAADFQMIEDDTVSVVCPYDDIAQELIKEIEYKAPNLLWFRRAQPYVVNIRKSDPVFQEQPQSFKELARDWYVLTTNIYDSHIGLNRSMMYSADQLNI